MQIRLPPVEPHINTVAATILAEAGMKRLMDVANEMSDESKCNPLLVMNWLLDNQVYYPEPRKPLEYDYILGEMPER